MSLHDIIISIHSDKFQIDKQSIEAYMIMWLSEKVKSSNLHRKLIKFITDCKRELFINRDIISLINCVISKE